MCAKHVHRSVPIFRWTNKNFDLKSAHLANRNISALRKCDAFSFGIQNEIGWDILDCFALFHFAKRLKEFIKLWRPFNGCCEKATRQKDQINHKYYSLQMSSLIVHDDYKENMELCVFCTFVCVCVMESVVIQRDWAKL